MKFVLNPKKVYNLKMLTTAMCTCRIDIMLLISKIEMSVINKMADVFVVNFITGEPWCLAK